MLKGENADTLNLLNDDMICGHLVTKKTKAILAVQLDLLRCFDEFCKKHQLKYFLWSGTLLGAVRHQGFIPWDDDIDVAMPRADYETFKRLAAGELEHPYSLQTNENDTGIFRGGLCRLRNKETTGVEFSDVERVCNWGIWIDILALDYVCADDVKRKEQLRKIGLYQRLCMLQTEGEGIQSFQVLPPIKKRIYRFIVKHKSREWLLKQLDEACMACPENEARYVSVFTRNFRLEWCQCFYKEDFAGSVELEFEGRKYSAPVGYKRYLGMVNGNYMEYPPVEQRVPHHLGIFDPGTPYEKWQKQLARTFEDAGNKIIVLFGAGNMFEDYMRRYGERFRPAFAVDNGQQKWGRMIHGLMIHDPEELRKIPKDKLRVIICNIYYYQIVEQLQGMGIYDYCLHIERREWLNDILFPTKNTRGGVCDKAELVPLKMFCGSGIAQETGLLEKNISNCMVTEQIYRAIKGSRLVLLNCDYKYAVATYSKSVDGTFIYTYCYQPEENWTAYNHDFSEASFIKREYLFQDERYFRVCVMRSDGGIMTEEEAAGVNQILQFVSMLDAYEEKVFFADEVRETATSILRKRTERSLVLALLTDTHYTIGGTWEDTAHNLAAVHSQANFDGIVHLGDITDGLMSKDLIKEYSDRVIGDLLENKIPLYVLPGNHDSNYFGGNPDVLTDAEQCEIYEKHMDNYVCRPDERFWYYVDEAEFGLRMLFLASFDYRETVRYGFLKEEVDWVEQTLKETPAGYKVLVFSHVPPLPQIHFWSDTIRNGEELMAVLENHHRHNQNCVMGFIHGHNHADCIYTERDFPIIAVGANKCEDFKVKKPEGSVTPDRKLNTVTQDLWDVVILTPEISRMEFVRFGAGEDRVIES